MNSRSGPRTTHSAYLALGDSYTIGEGVPCSANWPAQLAARLRGAGIDIREPHIIATTGWTAGELSAAMDAANFAPPYSLVTLSTGVNNQYRGGALDEYRDQFRMLLQRAIALASDDASRVVVVSIPDWGVTPFARAEGRDVAPIARGIDAFNAAACAEVERTGAHWVDVTAISRAPETRGWLAADGLHPSARQYARWVDAILPSARRALGDG
ncbi:MAG TPA: SGNH/GDSL hydrolase family protein [Rhodanobacteraceae bacterium]|nr:SGNH/GDSL hydrolase family protein [Rhodanobacteraceae bacterium]